MFRGIFTTVVVAYLIFSFSSCKKITEDELINGIWQLEYVYLDSSTNNYMNTLPGFTMGNSCCYYRMDFQDNGVILAYYSVNDSVQYVVAGQWQLPVYNQIFIQCDKFMWGTFNISKPGIKHWQLSTTADYIPGYDTMGLPKDTVSATLQIYKD